MSVSSLPKVRCFPDQIFCSDFAGYCAQPTTDFLLSDNELHVIPKEKIQMAEFGVWKGAMSYQFAKFLGGVGTLHLFDYQQRVDAVADNLRKVGYSNVKTWRCSDRLLDSYNWQLMKILRASDAPIFNYVYIDGAHTWGVDALTFLLCDKLMMPGGYIDFDDYDWKIRGSSLDPSRFPETELFYTTEQIDEPQVKLIVDILVKRDFHYREVVYNRIFQKLPEG